MTKKTGSKRHSLVEQLVRDLAAAQAAVDRGQYQDGREQFLRIRAAAAREGIRSPHVAWGVAVACDYLGDLEAAMEFIREALELDPLAAPFNRSFEIISDRIRRTLAALGRPANDESTPKLYSLLVQAAGADEATHLVMARYLLVTGDREAALKLTEAVTTLFPGSAEAWALKAEIAVTMGDHQKAVAATAEAAALGHEPVPFAIPGTAQG